MLPAQKLPEALRASGLQERSEFADGMSARQRPRSFFVASDNTLLSARIRLTSVQRGWQGMPYAAFLWSVGG